MFFSTGLFTHPLDLCSRVDASPSPSLRSRTHRINGAAGESTDALMPQKFGQKITTNIGGTKKKMHQKKNIWDRNFLPMPYQWLYKMCFFHGTESLKHVDPEPCHSGNIMCCSVGGNNRSTGDPRYIWIIYYPKKTNSKNKHLKIWWFPEVDLFSGAVSLRVYIHHPKKHGWEVLTLSASVLFYIPMVRELALWTRCIDARKSVATKALKKKRSFLARFATPKNVGVGAGCMFNNKDVLGSCFFHVFCFGGNKFSPKCVVPRKNIWCRDPITEPENGFMEPQWGDWTPRSFDKVRSLRENDSNMFI